MGKTAWSLICSADSGGSTYNKLLDRRRRPPRLFSMSRSADNCGGGGGFVFEVNETERLVRGISKGDSLAVLEEVLDRLLEMAKAC